jgi:hypothetical protein
VLNVLRERSKKATATHVVKSARPDNTQRKSKRCSALCANVVALNPNEVRSGALTVLRENSKKETATHVVKSARPDNTQRKSKRHSALSANVVALNPNEVRSGALTVHPESSGNLLAVPVARYA